MAQIIMISKPNKDSVNVRSYRPSLLPVISKLFEKLLLQKLIPVIAENRLIPNHQFGFRSKHVTVEQVPRITNKITLAWRSIVLRCFLTCRKLLIKYGIIIFYLKSNIIYQKNVTLYSKVILTKDIFSSNNKML